jgi:3-dehydroquinate synthetase
MSDSSIGGKTGVDTSLGKNLIGSIYNPELIISNTAYLNTLNKRNFKNGLVEIIKMGIIADHELFESLEKTNLGKELNNQ